jgi:hypothetical protein
MTGYEDLDANGRWSNDPDYGPLWTPSGVSPSWSPYGDGHWAQVQPWGWTWIDNASWGYAPFHYGRWVYAGKRWAWSPGRRIERPIYAPAVVGWTGTGASVAGPNATGWYPLAPWERFRPWYRSSPVYVDRVNAAVRDRVSRDANWNREHALHAVNRDTFAGKQKDRKEK